MKKELIYYSILTLTIALLLFFETNLFKDNTAYVSKVIDIESFDKLDIDLDCNIYVSLGEEQKVVFEGPAKYLNNVETRLEDGVLKISCKESQLSGCGLSCLAASWLQVCLKRSSVACEENLRSRIKVTTL